MKGIEPSYSAWKAAALPLSYTRKIYKTQICIPQIHDPNILLGNHHAAHDTESACNRLGKKWEV